MHFIWKVLWVFGGVLVGHDTAFVDNLRSKVLMVLCFMEESLRFYFYLHSEVKANFKSNP